MGRSRSACPFDDAQKLIHIFPRGFLAGERAEESRQVRGQFFVFENVIGDAAGVHGGVLEELEPVVRAGLEAELFCPGAQGLFIARRLENFAFDLAPVAGVVAVFKAKLPQAEPPPRTQFFDECSKHRLNLVSWYEQYHTQPELCNKILLSAHASRERIPRCVNMACTADAVSEAGHGAGSEKLIRARCTSPGLGPHRVSTQCPAAL